MQRQWTFLSNHAHVLIAVAKSPDGTLRQIAEEVGITERATHRIVSELVDEGMVLRTSRGRCNHYEINSDTPLRHPLENHCTVGQLLSIVLARPPDVGARSAIRSTGPLT